MGGKRPIRSLSLALTIVAGVLVASRTGSAQSGLGSDCSVGPCTPHDHLAQQEQAMSASLASAVQSAQHTLDQDITILSHLPFTSDGLDAKAKYDLQALQDAQAAQDAFAALVQAERMGSRQQVAPFADGALPPNGADPSAAYALGNQAPFQIALGPVKMFFTGAQVDLSIAAPNGGGAAYPTSFAIGSGWLPMLLDSTTIGVPIPYGGSMPAGKGTLFFSALPISAQSCPCSTSCDSNGTNCQTTCTCDDNYVYRFDLVDPSGKHTQLTQTPAETNTLCKYSGGCGALPTQFWSQDGQSWLDVSNACLPVVHYSDGSTEEFHAPLPGPGFGNSPFHGPSRSTFIDAAPDSYPTASCNRSSPLRSVDRNGNVTTFTFPDQYTRTITDSKGRTAILTFANSPAVNWWNSAANPVPLVLTTVKVLGPGGVPSLYTVNWSALSVNPSVAFPNIQLSCAAGVTGCGIGQSQNIALVSSVVNPDGRGYTFQYGAWGNLTRVSRPDGSVVTYQYGNSSQPASYAASYLALGNPVQSLGCTFRSTAAAWSTALQTLQGYGVVSETSWPQGDGSGQPSYVTTTSYSKVDLGSCSPDASGAATAGPLCCVQVWKTLGYPDGTQHKIGQCAVNQSYSGAVVAHGWELGEETWASGATAPLSAAYHGNPTTGQLYYGYETGPSQNPGRCGPSGGPIVFDRRPSSVVHVQDNLTTTVTTSYGDTISVNGANRNTVNKTAECVWLGSATSCTSGSGTKLIETDTTFKHDANYNARNLLRLASNVKVLDASGTIWSQQSIAYDQFTLAASSQPGLDTTYTNTSRGNATITTSYLTPASATGPVSSSVYYFDNGIVQKTQRPLEGAANRFTANTTGFDFGLCYHAASPILTFSGGGGTGATGSCAIGGGAVSGCTLSAGGAGYTAAPAAIINDGSGLGATATAQLTPTSVASLVYTWDGSTEFTTLPTVSLNGGGGAGAAASATMQIAGIVINSQGGSYTGAPTCTISGGGGSGATCSCIVPFGQVSCTVSNGGTGYTSQPSVTIAGGGASATASATMRVNSLTVTAAGSGYTSAPAVSIIGNFQSVVVNDRSGGQARLTPTSVASVTVTSGGSGYTTTNASNTTITTTVQNALGQAVSTVTDCYTDAILSVVDPNGNRSCTQYDGLGRVVETAVPGDVLSAQTQCTATSSPASCFVRDANNCAASGSAIGNGGAGPTTWTIYHPFGLGGIGYDQAFSESHEKDGTTGGKLSKTFTDGLGRKTAVCSRIDPITSAGAGANDETCIYTSYDNMGRAFQTFSPFYATDLTKAARPASGQYTQQCYDAIGRVTGNGLVWSGSWSCGTSPPSTSQATLTSYGSVSNSWAVTTTNPNGAQSRTLLDGLGRAVELDQYLCASAPCTATTGTKLATIMTYDGAGRLITTTDPQGNVLTLSYDGLGRRTGFVDPDMGSWSYAYDNNGNLISQTDAKHQTIAMYYDAIDRLTVADLPPAGPGREDKVNTYDGTLPTCAPIPCTTAWSGTATTVCCDDHNPATTKSCDPATVTCNALAAPFPGVCVPGTSRTVACGSCGSETDTCDATGKWVLGTCGGQGACTPGSTRSLACGNCGSETDTCSASCQWTAGSCTGQGVCAAGSTRSLACGNCGSETDTCSSSCQWTQGTCSNQGPCAPGSTRSIGCGNCGSEMDTCSSSCQWSAGSCTGQGECAPGAVQNVSCGTCGHEFDSCDSTCQWSSGACNDPCGGGCVGGICN